MNVYEIITDRILRKLEQGTAPWRRGWDTAQGMPRSLVSGKEYRGINAFMLGTAGHSSPYYLTFKQALARGGAVRKGEHGYPVVFWKMLEKDNPKAQDGKDHIPMLRYYTVFNADQCDGIDYPKPDGLRVHEPIRVCQDTAARYLSDKGPSLSHGGARAYYRPSTDSVSMPELGAFERREEYYSVLFHELSHSTGHKSRLDRSGISESHSFGDSVYSREELVAEMGAAMLCGHCGIDSATLDNSAAYLAGWVKVLRGDSRLVVTAAAQAQKAADLILGRKWEAPAHE